MQITSSSAVAELDRYMWKLRQQEVFALLEVLYCRLHSMFGKKLAKIPTKLFTNLAQKYPEMQNMQFVRKKGTYFLKDGLELKNGDEIVEEYVHKALQEIKNQKAKKNACCNKDRKSKPEIPWGDYPLTEFLAKVKEIAFERAEMKST